MSASRQSPAGTKLCSYRLYTIDRDGHIVDVRAFEAASDLAAMVAVEPRSGELCELWTGDRRVSEFPGGRADASGDVRLTDRHGDQGARHCDPKQLS